MAKDAGGHGSDARLDHGVLNVPLAKRGNINAQLDRYKAGQARDARTKQAELTAMRRLASAAVKGVSDARMAELGKPHGMTAKQTRAQFISMAVSRPHIVMKTFEKEKGR